MSGRATLATARFRLATAATRMSATSTSDALSGAVPVDPVDGVDPVAADGVDMALPRRNASIGLRAPARYDSIRRGAVIHFGRNRGPYSDANLTRPQEGAPMAA